MLAAHQLCLSSMSDERNQSITLLALGSNRAGRYLHCSTVLRCALAQLKSRGVIPVAVSPFYSSQPLGCVRQPKFVNAVVAVRTTESIGTLLRLIKRIERSMGRQSGPRWGPRVVDIDILSHRGQSASGQSLGWIDCRARATVKRRGQVVLPHPEMHRRNFVLQPLCDIMPHWFHPIFKSTAQQLQRRLARQHQSRLVHVSVENTALTCDWWP